MAQELVPGALLDEEASFVHKLSHFRSCVASRRAALRGLQGINPDIDDAAEQPISPLVINRARILDDSLMLLGYSDPIELEANPIRISFEGEPGIDDGGVAKDWYTSVAKELVQGKNSLLSCSEGTDIEICAGGEGNLKPDSDLSSCPWSATITKLGTVPIVCLNITNLVMRSEEQSEVDLFRSIGLFLGKALVDERIIGYRMDPILLKWLLSAADCSSDSSESAYPNLKDVVVSVYDVNTNKHPTIYDLAYSDYHLYRSLQWIMDATGPELKAAALTFSTTLPTMASDAEQATIELIPEGSATVVTIENRNKFVELLFQWLIKGRYEPALMSILDGFRAVVPPCSLRYFSVPELSMILSGRPIIDIVELRKGAIYCGIKFSRTHDVALWFWEVIESLDQSTLSKFLMFCTGSSHMPITSYQPPFNVTMHDYSEDGKVNNDRFPEVHTCFNQIVFPEYSSKKILEEKLQFAIENMGNAFTIL